MRKRAGSGSQAGQRHHAPQRREPQPPGRRAAPLVLVRIRDQGVQDPGAAAPWSSSDRDIQDRYSR